MSWQLSTQLYQTKYPYPTSIPLKFNEIKGVPTKTRAFQSDVTLDNPVSSQKSWLCFYFSSNMSDTVQPPPPPLHYWRCKQTWWATNSWAYRGKTSRPLHGMLLLFIEGGSQEIPMSTILFYFSSQDSLSFLISRHSQLTAQWKISANSTWQPRKCIYVSDCCKSKSSITVPYFKQFPLSRVNILQSFMIIRHILF